MFHIHRHRRRHFRKTTELSAIGLILAIGISAIETIWPIYLDFFGLSQTTIGFISAFLVLVTFVTAFYSTPILEKFREYKILLLSLFTITLSYLILAFFEDLYLLIFLSVIITMFTVLRINSFDILFRDESNMTKLNADEGFLFALLNVGWFIGPLLAGLILGLYGIPYVFILSAFVTALGALMLLRMPIKLPEKKIKKVDSNFKKNLSDYIKNKKVHLPYLVSAGVEFWWALIFIYVPLFIIESGLRKETVGIFLAVIAIPLIILEYPVGKLSSKKGFEPFLFWGFFLLGILSINLFFVSTINVVLIVLVIGSFFMSMIEPLQDSYFFKQVKSEEEEKYYPIFATANDVGSFFGKFSIAVVLLYLPQHFVYLFVGIVMCLIGLCSRKVTD